MQTSPITNSPSFGWDINVRYAKHGRYVTQITEYKPDTGNLLLRTDTFRKGKLMHTVKELYNRQMKLLGRKCIAYDSNGKRLPKEWFI